MISIRFTSAMGAVVQVALHHGPDSNSLALDKVLEFDATRSAVKGTLSDLEVLAERLETRATVSLAPKDGPARQLARHAANRCRVALAKAHARAGQPMIPTTITNEEFDLLVGNATPCSEVIARLERRELVERWTMGQTMTERGLAIVTGSPPADLVPFSFFNIGARLVMAFSVTGPDRHTFAAGSDVFILAKDDRRHRFSVADFQGRHALHDIHPRIVRVPAPSAPST